MKEKHIELMSFLFVTIIFVILKFYGIISIHWFLILILPILEIILLLISYRRK
jgi:hypothetical protein